MAKIGINLLFIRPGINGGTETYSREVIRHIAKLGPKHSFVVYATSPVIEDWWDGAANFRLILLDEPAKSVARRILFEQTRFVSILERDGIEVLFSPGYISPMRGNFKKVTTVHDLFADVCPQYLSRARRLYWGLMVPASMRRSDAIVAVSDTTANDIRKHYPEVASKVRVIKEAASTEFENARASQSSGDASIKLPPAYILGVSTLQPIKNIQNLIKAFAILKRQDSRRTPDLVIVGRDALFTVQKWAAEEGVADHVHVTGFIAIEQLVYVYKNASVFVMASHYEGFGLPVLEAMSCAVPVVCSDIPVFREIAQDAALFFQPGFPEDIAAKISSVLAELALAAELRQRGARQARNFSWTSCAEEIVALFNELCGHAAPAELAATGARI